MRQLDLLSWSPPRQVIAFPLAKRVGKVRRVADVLMAKNGQAAATYWRQTVTTLGEQLQRAGIDRKAIDEQLRAFHDAVQRELQSRNGHGQRPGGSAA